MAVFKLQSRQSDPENAIFRLTGDWINLSSLLTSLYPEEVANILDSLFIDHLFLQPFQRRNILLAMNRWIIHLNPIQVRFRKTLKVILYILTWEGNPNQILYDCLHLTKQDFKECINIFFPESKEKIDIDNLFAMFMTIRNGQKNRTDYDISLNTGERNDHNRESWLSGNNSADIVIQTDMFVNDQKSA